MSTTADYIFREGINKKPLFQKVTIFYIRFTNSEVWGETH